MDRKLILFGVAALSLCLGEAGALAAPAAEGCAPSFAVLNKGAAITDPKLDSFVSAVKEVNSKEFFDPYLLEVVLSSDTPAEFGKKLLEALNSQALLAPIGLPNTVTIKRRIFPTDFFFRSSHEKNGWARLPSAPSPAALSRRMPYLEYTPRGWVAHPKGGGDALILSLLEEGKPLVVYRGTNVVEADLWRTMKALREGEKGPVSTAELRALDVLIMKDRRVGKEKLKAPEMFRSGWAKIRKDLTGKSREYVARKVLEVWTAGYPAIFTTPDRRAALRFAHREPGTGAVLSFEIDPAELRAKGLKGTYAGIEDNYIELAFSTTASRDMLLNSFEGHAQEALVIPPAGP